MEDLPTRVAARTPSTEGRQTTAASIRVEGERPGQAVMPYDSSVQMEDCVDSERTKL